ncbi:hypothetical protein N0V90_007643 [Kalmusia sp. IMI 367209]|nr:hypothetical protein N0V90_007643 [Kalmusia sp. IMI 367209]
MARPTTLGANGPKDTVFVKARDHFLTSLLPDERAQFSKCDSAQQLLETIQNLPALRKNGGILTDCVYSVHRLDEKLSPYFESIGWVVQSHPEFAAIGWGAFRLVLRLASNYASFFDKLLRTLNRLASEFPPYHLVAEHREKLEKAPTSAGIWHSISALYASLLRFLYQVVRVFRKKDGTAKRTTMVAASISWKPFDRWFGDLLEDMEMHRKVVAAQIQVFLCVRMGNIGETEFKEASANGKELREYLKNLQDVVQKMLEKEKENAQRTQHESRASIVARLRQWIHPPEFALELENAQYMREKGTTEWLFDNPTFAQWNNKNAEGGVHWPKDMVLWVHGNPGSGKTILAASTVEKLQRESDKNTCYFFFRANDPDYEKFENAYRSILAQTLKTHHHDLGLLDKLAFLLEEQSCGQSKISAQEALDMIKLCASDGYIQNILLDGLDECIDRGRLMHLSSGLPAALCESSCKLILFGRPHLRALPLFSRCNAIEIGNSTSKDIDILIQKRLRCFLDEGLLPSNINIDHLSQRLHTGAGSMILWAHLMLELLQSYALSASQRIEIIQSVTLPEGLDKMYDRIVETLLKKTSVEYQLAVWLLMWLSFSGRPLSATELQVTTRFMQVDKPAAPADFTNFDHTVISTCASLVEKSQMLDSVQQKIVPCYRLIHLSAQEYFKTRFSMKAQQFMVSPRDAHHVLARCCLQYLCSLGPNKCVETTDGQSFDALRFDEDYPFCAYASQHWTHHLLNAETATEGIELPSTTSDPSTQSRKALLQIIDNFLARGELLQAYIQARYTFEDSTQGKCMMREWAELTLERYASRDQSAETFRILNDVRDFAIYLDLLAQEWGAKLHLRPSLIWHEVNAFTPCRFIPPSKTQLHPLVSQHGGHSDLSSKPLSQISEVNKEQDLVSILTIWPSRAYEERIASFRDINTSPANVRDSCSGWMACYEIWCLDESPRRIMCAARVEWRLQFPVAISPCLNKFSILRTVYTLEITDMDKAPVLHEAKLPLDSHPMFQATWRIDAPRHLTNTVAAPSRSSESLEIYKYWLAFDDSGSSLLFTDRVSEKYVHVGYFRICSSGLRSGILEDGAFPGFLSAPSTQISTGINITRPAFHPSQCLIAFSSGPSVYLWAYKSRDPSRTRGYLTPPPLDQSHKDKSGRLWTIYTGGTAFTNADSICFSSDGKHLVVKVASECYPNIVPIPKHVFRISESTQQAIANTVNDADPFTSTIRAAMQNNDTDMLVRSTTALQIGELTAMPLAEGNGVATLAIASNNSVELHLFNRQSSTTRSATVQLLQLPDVWADTAAVKTSMGMHPTKHDILRIILNQAQTSWYSIGETAKRGAPFVIDRRVSEMRRVQPVTMGRVESETWGLQIEDATAAHVSERMGEAESYRREIDQMPHYF